MDSFRWLASTNLFCTGPFHPVILKIYLPLQLSGCPLQSVLPLPEVLPPLIVAPPLAPPLQGPRLALLLPLVLQASPLAPPLLLVTTLPLRSLIGWSLLQTLPLLSLLLFSLSLLQLEIIMINEITTQLTY